MKSSSIMLKSNGEERLSNIIKSHNAKLKENGCNCKEIEHVTPIIKVVDYCNFSCGFCRYAKNDKKSTMDFETYKIIVEKACDYNVSHNCNHLTLVYHGGEPLLWGISNYERAMAFQKELKRKYPYICFHNNIQTNGYLINPQWIDFFKANDFNIGISIDGPDEINFHGNSVENQRVLSNIHELGLAKCSFSILSVITDDHRRSADAYYDFLVKNEIHSVGLCFCVYDEKSGKTVTNDVLTGFLTRLFERYYFGSHALSIREFEYPMRYWLGLDFPLCTYSYRRKCGNYYSISSNGDVNFCDPYSLNGSLVGNLINCSFNDIKTSSEMKKIKTMAINSAQQECDKCDIKNICGGGCFRHVLPSGKHAFCDTFKVLYPLIKQTISNSMYSSYFEN